jgi:hypothetical protein
MLIFTWLSEKINRRTYFGLYVQVWLFTCILALAVLPSGASRWSVYALMTVLLSYPSPHPMHVAWTSRNSNSVRTRTVSAALLNMAAQINSILSANIYRAEDRPEYRSGNRVLVGIASWNIVVYIFIQWYYVRRNRKKQQAWNAMTTEEKSSYMSITTDKGNKRLDFRFVY